MQHIFYLIIAYMLRLSSQIFQMRQGSGKLFFRKEDDRTKGIKEGQFTNPHGIAILMMDIF